MKRKISKIDLFKQLTWDDLEEWAGGKVLSRGQSYQRSHKVQGMAQTTTGAVVAWVQGGKRYATKVDFEDDELISTCTCPYGGTCKHAVAALLQYLDLVKKDGEVPQIGDNDPRFALLNGLEDEQRLEEDEEWDEEYVDGTEDGNGARKTPGKSAPAALKGFLEVQTKEQLIALLKDLSEKYSLVREDLEDRQNLSKGSVKRIVAAVRKEIHELSSEPGWMNHWNHEGYTPDYSRVKDRLKSLLVKGHADEVVALGRELLEAGTSQVEMSHDEGETGMEISSCLEIVFQALPQSSLSPVEQMLWAIDAELKDEYELCHGSESFWKKKQKASDWNAAADRLMGRLKHLQPSKGEDSFSRDYHRDRLTNWIIHTLEQAGRHEEAISLCKEEALITGSYDRLVDALKKAKRFDEAEEWIHRGIKATQKKLPGVAKQLRDALREMREEEGEWLKVAAFRVEEYLEGPSMEVFKQLKKVAERAKVWPTVRKAVLLYLESGKLPQTEPSWPLPETGVGGADRIKEQFPLVEDLIDIAIAEKRPEEVLQWYDYRKSKKQPSWEWNHYQENEIAEAVASRYPDRALAIWKNVAEREIARTQPKAYETAAGYLRKVRGLLRRLKREEELRTYLSGLRQTNIKKKKLLEILDHLESPRIIGGS